MTAKTTPITFTVNTRAWRTNSWTTFDELVRAVEEGRADAINLMYINNNMSDCEGWAEVGTAQITVTLFDRDTVMGKELEGLKAQLQTVRADNHMRENAILDRISKLQAIEYTGEA